MPTRDFYPLDAPGMPPPGPSFVRQAEYESPRGPDAVARLYERALYEPGFTMPILVRRPDVYRPVRFIPGHLWSPSARPGPAPAEVMVIGKMPGAEEDRRLATLVGPSGRLLYACAREAGLTDMASWYVTNVVKFVPPDGSNAVRRFFRDCLPLLHQELRLVRPKVIVCLGADAAVALFGPRTTLSQLEGRVTTLTVDLRRTSADPPKAHTLTIPVIAVLHPAQALRAGPETARTIVLGLRRLLAVREGELTPLAESVDHRVCRTPAELDERLAQAADELLALPPAERWLAVDAEWHGSRPHTPGSYLRTVQVSWRSHQAVVIVLSAAGGRPVLPVSLVAERFRAWAARVRPRVAGHFFIADLEWLEHFGFHLLPYYRVPDDVDDAGRWPWEQVAAGAGGFDTAMAAHTLDETAPLGLEQLALRYTAAPRYDLSLAEWFKGHVAACRREGRQVDGFGECPDEILLPYAAYDADVTRRLVIALAGRLDRDPLSGRPLWEPFWESMVIQPVLLEMRRVGVKIDLERLRRLTDRFAAARDDVLTAIRQSARWPDFNPRSSFHVREYLFGERYSGRPQRQRPEHGVSLHLRPLLDTSKPPRRWDDVVARGLEAQSTPSTSKSTLAILAYENPSAAADVHRLRDFRFLDQVLKTVLAGDDEEDSGGLAAYADPVDQSVRTRLVPTAETGRWRSSQPNLQNLSKTRDADYARLVPGDEPPRLRSVLRAPRRGEPVYDPRTGNVVPCPDDMVLIEADYKGAELYGMALLAGDELMIEHARRNQLPDGETPGVPRHPDFYDIHSSIAVMAFRLDCEPTKAGLKSIGKSHLRTVAKSVIFGIAYGRQAAAITLAAREQGVTISVDDAQQVIDTVFATYPKLKPFFDDCRRRAADPRWLVNAFGRVRRFPVAADRSTLAEFERQAMNFPVQGLVASLLDRGVAALTAARDRIWRETGEWLFDWQLAIHDAILVRAPLRHAEYVAERLIPWALCECVPVYPTDLDGRPTGRGPYTFGVDVEITEHWGVPLTTGDCRRLGLSSRWAKNH